MTRPHITDLLDGYARGEERARAQIYERVYSELKQIARQQLRRSGGFITMNPTTLLHETWLKLDRSPLDRVKSSAHFFNIFSQAMRHVLVDIARMKMSTRHGAGVVQIELDEQLQEPDLPLSDILAVDKALTQLQAVDGELAELVQWHFFGGISFSEIAKIRNITERTVRRHWNVARLFLLKAIE